jgi:hypothetical protein
MDEKKSYPRYCDLLNLNTTSRKTINIQEPILRWHTIDVVNMIRKHCSQVYIDAEYEEKDENTET